jgi:hypothetical protein
LFVLVTTTLALVNEKTVSDIECDSDRLGLEERASAL